MVGDANDERAWAPLCIWCGAPWSDENVKIENAFMSGGCDNCGYGAFSSATMSLCCHQCGREMCRREVELAS